MAKGIEAWMWVCSEDSGWGSVSGLGRGNFLFADDENLDVGKTFLEQDTKIVAGRGIKASTRISGKSVPGGDFTFQFRSEDSVPLFMAHYQKYIGTQPVNGTIGSSIFTFVPEKGCPTFGGSAFGTGSYTSPAGNVFTAHVIKKFFNTTQNNGTNAQWFKNVIVDEMEVTAEGETDAKMKVSIKAGTCDFGTAVPSSVDPNSSLGSYTALPAFQYFSGTISVGGTAQDITKLNFMTKNNLEELMVLGKQNPARYKYGKFSAEGSFDIDMPKDGMRYFGSMVGGSSFAVSATLWNSASDFVAFSFPNCRWNPFNANIKGGAADVAFTLPFKAYESDDGNTAPVTVQVMTTTWGSTLTARI